MVLWVELMKQEIIKKIEEVLKEEGVKDPKVNLVPSAYLDKADYSTNVAMVYAKEIDNTPMYLAERIKSHLESQNIFGITIAQPGFINFFFDKEYYANALFKPTENENIFSGKTFVVEHTQPNPFKEFHIGHLMNNTIGESIKRIFVAGGAEVKTATYHGDVGLHVAKAVWAIKQNVDFKDAYAKGHSAYEDNEESKKEIIEINKKIYDKSDSKINEIYQNGRKASFEYFETIYRKLDSDFDAHFYESESGEIGKQIVLDNLGKVFEEGEGGAVIFKGEEFEPKTHTRVFLNSDKLPTYEAKEVGLAKIKKDKWKYDESVTVTANEQDSFFKVVEVAIGEVFPELKGKLHHLSHGMLKLPSGKMSSRTGTIISAESLINQVKDKVRERIDDDVIAEQIAIGAIKYSILRQAIGGDIIFDFDKSISFEGDSGPYLQYSVVRAHSLLKKAEGVVSVSDKLPENWETTNLEKLLERFTSVVEKAGREYAPHHIATYLIELSGEFNSFYASNRIIAESDTGSSYRLAITRSFAETMTQGLFLLGIKVPARM